MGEVSNFALVGVVCAPRPVLGTPVGAMLSQYRPRQGRARANAGRETDCAGGKKQLTWREYFHKVDIVTESPDRMEYYGVWIRHKTTRGFR
ncbi:hypothetical protein ON010_g10662 [Phytophthora cinnamomi]|nr:hypothetical protein ON010_g10662 [Phytophthora cinnamomi]